MTSEFWRLFLGHAAGCCEASESEAEIEGQSVDILILWPFQLQQELKPSLNESVGSKKRFLYQPVFVFARRFQQEVCIYDIYPYPLSTPTADNHQIYYAASQDIVLVPSCPESLVEIVPRIFCVLIRVFLPVVSRLARWPNYNNNNEFYLHGHKLNNLGLHPAERPSWFSGR